MIETDFDIAFIGDLYQFAFKIETEAAARSLRRRTEQYVEESDAATTKVCT